MRDDVDVDEAAHALLRGDATPGDFVRRTRRTWRRLAAGLFARWRRKLPAWVEEEDVEQVLVVLAIAHVIGGTSLSGERIQGWRPGGMRAGRYAAWGAVHRAQREIHRWRGASLHGADTRNPSRVETAFSRAFGPDVDPLQRLGAVQAGQEDDRGRREALEGALALCATGAEAVALQALWAAGGSVPEAAELLVGDYAARVEAGVRGVAAAERLVRRTVVRVAGASVLAEIEAGDRLPGPVPADMFAEEDEDRASGPLDAGGVRSCEDGDGSESAERAA